MLNSVMLRNRKNLLGQRVCVEGNKYGIIKFYGETSFAEGIWCGIELEECVGENNGMINNIPYFTCRDNHGIFVPESEANIIPTLESYLNDLSSVEPVSSLDNESSIVNSKAELFCKLSVPNDSQPSPARSILNESFTISKGYYREEKLSVITEENSGHCYCCDMLHLKSLTDGTDLDKCESLFFTDQDSKLVSVKSKNHDRDVKDDDIEGSCDSDESLGVLPPDLLDGLSCDSLSFDKEEPDTDLNVTVNLSYKQTEKFSSQLLHELKSNNELEFSPICNKLNISCVRTNESPFYCSSSMPVCASTPKYESNYSYIIDDEIVSAQDTSENSHISNKMQKSYEGEMDVGFRLNRTTVIETVLDAVTNMPTSACSESGENVNFGQNILNVTCNMTKPMNTDKTSLNKTFESLGVLADKYIMPTIMSRAEPHLINNLSTPNLRSDQLDAAEFDLCKENVLNLTCDIVRKADDNEPECEAFSSNPENYETNILNTTRELGKTQLIGFLSEDKSDVYAGNTSLVCKENALNLTCDIVRKADDNEPECGAFSSNPENYETNILNTTHELGKTQLIGFLSEDKSDVYAGNTSLVCKENALNLTCDIVRKADDNEPECGAFSSNPENYETNILNTTHELGKTQLIGFIREDKSDVYTGNTDCSRTGDILNATYEKIDKSDAGSDTLKCITNLEESKKPSQLRTKINSKKTRVLSFSTKDTAIENKGIRNKSSVFNRNESTQKSIGRLGKTNVTKTELDAPARRNSFSSHTYTSSNVPKTKISYSSAKGLTLNCSARDSNGKCSLINKETLDNVNSCDLLNKTVRCSASKLSQNSPEERKSVSYIALKGQRSLLNETINLPPPVSDASKTVVKKPRNSIQIIHPSKCFLDLGDASLDKNIKTDIGSFQKSASVSVPSTKEGEMPKKLNEDKTSAIPNKTDLKKPVMEERTTISRLPQKTLSQKNIHSNFQSSNEKPSSNIARPQSAISGLKPPSTRRNSQSSTSRKSLIQTSELGGGATLNDTIVVSAPEKSTGSKGLKPPSTRRNNQSSTSRKSLIQASEVAGRATLNDIILVSAQESSKEKNTGSLKNIQSFSKIPSISQLPRLKEKSSGVIPRRLESSITKTFNSNLK